jgi:hypothetical protein
MRILDGIPAVMSPELSDSRDAASPKGAMDEVPMAVILLMETQDVICAHNRSPSTVTPV